MTKVASTAAQPERNGARREWESPELKRLGAIRHIAQRPPPFNQANNNKHS